MVFKLTIKTKNTAQVPRVVFFDRADWDSAFKKAKKILREESDVKSFELEEHEAAWVK